MKTAKDFLKNYIDEIEWYQDYQGKQDFDAPLLSISSRAYPPSYNGKTNNWSCYVSLMLGDGNDYAYIVKEELFAKTEESLKVKVRNWYKKKIKDIGLFDLEVQNENS